MSIHHAASGELVRVAPLGDQLPQTASTALLKSTQLEVIRRILPAGKSVPEHQVGGEITIFCLEGEVELRLRDRTQRMQAFDLVFLEANVPYAFHAEKDSAVLLTVALKNA